MYVVFGYPGAGKGTFAEVMKSTGCIHLSTGDILRSESLSESGIGKEYKGAIQSASSLLPTKVILEVIFNKLEEAISNHKFVILDGFPKTLEQVYLLENFVKKHSLSDRIKYIYIKVDKQTSQDRIPQRISCSSCNKLYNLKYCPPKNPQQCDLCQGKIIQRKSDTVEDLSKRMELFEKTVEKVIEFYQERNRLDVLSGEGPLEECILRFKQFK